MGYVTESSRLTKVSVVHGLRVHQLNKNIMKSLTGHKSHMGQKKCFTPKYTEKCIYIVVTEHTFYYEHLTHKGK